MILGLKIGIDIFIMIIGTILGSFFNVCIYRIPKGESIAYPPSHCGSCGHNLKWYELIPIVSWICLKRKCKVCGEKISAQYPLIELLTGIVYWILFLKFGFTLSTLKYIILFSILIIAAIIDIKTKEVYFKISLVGFIFGIVFSFIELFYGKSIINFTLSIGIPLIILGIIYLISKSFDGFGLGDLEMFLVVAFYLSLTNILIALFLAIVLGGIVGVFYILRGHRKKQIAFVPFIAIGAFLSVTIGTSLLNFYISIL